MNKYIVLAVSALMASAASAQSAIDAFTASSTEMRGTARYMSMAGAFTALGGDISTLVTNPAGIGIYRSSDIAVTVDLNMRSNTATAGNFLDKHSQTKFYCNNFGYVGAIRLDNETMPYFAWGASYQRTMSFDRVYKGYISNLNGSASNYLAGISNGISPADLLDDYNSSYNPYQDSYAPWMAILGYNAYMTNPTGQSSQYNGLWQNGTTGSAAFDVVERGYADQYSINFGGNISNQFYWGMGVGILDLQYSSSVYYSEDLNNALIANATATSTVTGSANTGLESFKRITGTGFNLKFGAIYRPINELRLGLSVHTPTWYNLRQEGWAAADFTYSTGYDSSVETDEGYLDYFEWKLRAPWRMTVGAAGVIGSKAIVSAEYEFRPYGSMNVSDDDGFKYTSIQNEVKSLYKTAQTVRVGAEYRIDPSWSVRLGAARESSPLTASADNTTVNTLGADDTETQLSYTLDKETIYGTAGIGFKYQALYVDAAYVYKHQKSTYHAFTPSAYASAPQADLKLNSSQVVLTVGVRF